MFDDGADDGAGDDDEDDEDGDTDLFPSVHPSMPNPRPRFRATVRVMLMGPCLHIVKSMRLGYLPPDGKTMHLRPGTVPPFPLYHSRPSHLMNIVSSAL